MKTSLLGPLFAIGLSLVLWSCQNSTDPGISDSSSSSREISAKLRSTCTAFPANASGRTLRTNADTVSPVVQVQTNPVDSFSYQIYDSTGSLVAKGVQVLVTYTDSTSTTLKLKQPDLLWDAKDTAGNTVPSGHYFLFDVVKESTGAVVQKDSSCIGVLRAVSD